MKRDDFTRSTARLHVDARQASLDAGAAVLDLYLAGGKLDLSDPARRDAFLGNFLDAVTEAIRNEALRQSRASLGPVAGRQAA